MKKNKSSNIMRESSLSDLINEFNFFVPEIQREYVWGNNQREILSTFCTDIIESKKTCVDPVWLQQKINKLTQERKFNEIQEFLVSSENGSPINIGFLYSYEPNYKMDQFPDNEAYKDAYLIDGQQRFTTLFLILFYLSLKEDKSAEFSDLFRVNVEKSTIAFDYRVRNLTHIFILELIKNINNTTQLNDVTDSIWFINEFNNDVTISSMINGLKIIEQEFMGQKDKYFDFIMSQIKFWHFKTEKTNQGEELYITMNSRGKQLEENETVKAKLFEELTPDQQMKWSEKWENWQDFFWKNKINSNNADDGFNEFLNCIAGLESYLNDKNDFVESVSEIFDKHLFANLTLEIIEDHFDSFQLLFKNQNDYTNDYNHCTWVKKALKQLQQLIFDDSTNWFVDYELANKATERRRMVFVWSILHFIRLKKQSEFEHKEIYRLLRVYWLRFNNHDRAVNSIKDRVNQQMLVGVWNQKSTKDEELRHSFFIKQTDEKTLREFESCIWKIEDHELNLNGYQVENMNSSHLIDYENLNSTDELRNIFDRFIALFPKNKPKSNMLNDVLIFYGFYGMRRTPHYYYNYDFSSWRRVIRDLDSTNNCFKTFFSNYDGNNLKKILKKKKIEFLLTNKDAIENAVDVIECNNLITTVRYHILISDNIWEKGGFIAHEEYSSLIPLTSFERNNHLYNTKGSFRGYGFSSFSRFLPNEPLEKLRGKLNGLNR